MHGISVDETITSFSNPRVKQAVKLRDRRQRDKLGLFLIEGYRELKRAVASGLPIEELYISPELFLGENEAELIERARIERGARIVDFTGEVFHKISYRDRPDGLVALAKKPRWTLTDLPEVDQPLYLVAVTIEKPGNLGTMLRTADAVGAAGVIVCDKCTDVFNPNVVRASTGTLFTVPVAEATTTELLPWLRERHVKIAATSPDAETLYTNSALSGPLAVAIGSEQYGLPASWLAETDIQLRIPMAGEADSLNAAMATAVVLFESLRQRGLER